jgi:IS30 family transposase
VTKDAKNIEQESCNKDKQGQMKNVVSIDHKPSVVDEKSIIGDWQIGAVIGKNYKQAHVTIVERPPVSGYLSAQ